MPIVPGRNRATRRGAAALLALGLVAPSGRATAGDVPFAEPPPGQAQPASPGVLADVMGLTQLRHIKLWYAGRAKNWPLVAFEIAQIRATLDRAALYYNAIPVPFIVGALDPLGELDKAAQAKSMEAFTRAYGRLTNACNACHQAATVGFIVIQAPTASPFSDQRF